MFIMCISILVALLIVSGIASSNPPGKLVATGDLRTNDASTSNPGGSQSAAETTTPAFLIEKQEYQKGVNRKETANTLVLPELGAMIPLSSSCTIDGTPQGFNEKQIKLEWLIRDKVLWVHWREFPGIGSGNYTAEAHVILVVSEATAKEALRQSFLVWGKQGGGNYHEMAISFSASTAQGFLSLTRKLRCSESEIILGDPGPLAFKLGDGGNAQQYTFNQTSLYGLGEREKFVLRTHTLYFDLGGEQLLGHNLPEWEGKVFQLSEIAEFLIVYLCPRFGGYSGTGACTQRERETMIAKLKELNQGIDSAPTLKRPIRVPWDREVFSPLTKQDDFYPFSE